MDSTDEIARTLLADPAHSLECMQIVPFGEDRCLALFEIGDFDHRLSQSFIFDIRGFDPANSRLIFCENIWMTSLAAAAPTSVFGLEVGRTLWSPAKENWSVSFRADSFMNWVWMLDPACGFLIGDEGMLYRFDGHTWQELEDGDEVALNDIHGQTRDRIALVGDIGSLQLITGNVVDAVELPFDTDLLGVHLATDGRILIAGRGGLCGEVFENELRELDAPKSDFFSVVQFKGTTFWGDGDFGVFRQNGGALEPAHETGMGYDMRTDRDFLYCTGSDAMWRFDEKEWLALRPVYDDGWRLEARD